MTREEKLCDGSQREARDDSLVKLMRMTSTFICYYKCLYTLSSRSTCNVHHKNTIQTRCFHHSIHHGHVVSAQNLFLGRLTQKISP